MTKHHFTYLALGDSYTIGEEVPLYESFPYLVVQQLRKAGLHFHAPEIVAKTGWTSAELAEHILHTRLNDHYDFVTLLIGVNNQYRGLTVDDFIPDVEFLLRKAIHFTGNQPKKVMVLSIPDWGCTPFATGKNASVIAAEINAFNESCAAAAKKAGVHFINITDQTRTVKADPSLLAGDKLHYSGKAHAVWAGKVTALMKPGMMISDT